MVIQKFHLILAYDPAKKQFEWAEQAGGCSVSKAIMDSFAEPYKIVQENNVSYVDLVVEE